MKQFKAATTRVLAGALIGLGAAAVSSSAMAAAAITPPEPSAIPTRWELDLRVRPLRVVEMVVPGQGRQAFYFTTFLVTNNSTQPEYENLFFAPMFELATDKGELIASGRGVPREVTQELLKRLRNPFLQDQISVIGPLQAGEEYAREGLVIWPVGRTDVNEVTVHFIGFSGETKTVQTRDAETGEPREVVLRKTYMLQYDAPGMLVDRRAASEGGRVLRQRMNRWIMREPGTIIEAAPEGGASASRGG